MKMRFLALAVVAAALVPALAAAQQAPPVSPNSPGSSGLNVQRLADGIWFATPQTGANVSWISLPDGVLVIDAGIDASVARAVLDQIAKTAAKPVRYVVITHAHGDHAGGAPTFVAAGAQVIAQENAAGPIASLLGAPSTEGSPHPLLMAISERLGLLGGPRRVAIYYLGPAHTNGDLVVLLPEDRMLFTGDLVSNGHLPFLRSSDANIPGWKASLARLASLDVQRVVPGHGPVGEMQVVRDTGVYIQKVSEIAARLVAAKVPDGEIEEKLSAPENAIPNIPISPDHVANVKAAVAFERAHPSVAPEARPAPKKAPARKPSKG
jgi:cyclase